MKPESSAPWLLCLFVLGCAVLVSLLSGCATTSQSVDVRCEMPADGKPVAVVAYSLVSK